MGTIRVEIRGVREVVRALEKVPRDGLNALKREAHDISISLADKIKAAGRADTPQSARAAQSVRERKGSIFPIITAGGTKRSSAVLFGSEFGATRRFGWYRKGRYHDSVGKQFRPHRGASSYWFFKAVDRERPWVAREWRKAADDVIRQWGA